MRLREKTKRLTTIYEQFEKKAQPFKKEAICKMGCTFCCTDVGKVDTITLEGLFIWERMRAFPEPLRRRVREKLARNREQRKRTNIAECPFLKADDSCLIYDIRPFSCRQLYSVRECPGRGPTVHRQVVELAKSTVKELQALDETGYSGHLSFILHLFDRPDFRKLYLAGGFDPGKIAAFGKDRGLIINRFA